MENQQDSFISEMSLVADCLKEAGEYGLEAEIVTWALKAMKQDPSLSISQAIEYGFYEWVK